jgi:hypothetical protein
MYQSDNILYEAISDQQLTCPYEGYLVVMVTSFATLYEDQTTYKVVVKKAWQTD